MRMREHNRLCQVLQRGKYKKLTADEKFDKARKMRALNRRCNFCMWHARLRLRACIVHMLLCVTECRHIDGCVHRCESTLLLHGG